MSEKLSIQNIFEPQPEEYRIGPFTDPDDFIRHLASNERLIIPEACLSLIARTRPVHAELTLKSLTVHRRVKVTDVAHRLPRRVSAPWMFGWLLEKELSESEGPLEGGGSQNLFWLPELYTAYWGDDKRLYVELFEKDMLEIYDKVFLGDVSAV